MRCNRPLLLSTRAGGCTAAVPPAALSVEQFQDFFGWAGKHRPGPADDHRPLHEFGVLQQEVNNRLAADIVGRLQAERGKVFVFADQVGRRIGEQVKAPFKLGSGRGMLQILDDVELDVPLA